jgi:hypothetical protein
VENHSMKNKLLKNPAPPFSACLEGREEMAE